MAIDSALVLALLDALALIKLALTSGDGDNEFGQAPLVDEQSQRDDRETWLRSLASDAAYLLAVQQELAIAMSCVIVVGAETVLGNIHVLDPHLATRDHAIGIGEPALALTNRLDLGTGKDNARREGLNDLIIERGLAVLDVDGTADV